ncbi:MAG: hypothetical protein KGY38_02560 [Desulfobacterales bacterium]|nr:hypothetical protein [Desulfobacterales bacterium]
MAGSNIRRRCRFLAVAALLTLLLVFPAAGSQDDFKTPQNVNKDTAGKILPVEVRCSGNPAFGYKVEKKQARPESVLVIGPAETISEIETAKTFEIDITGASATVEKDAALDLPEGIRAVPERVSAAIFFEKQMVEKTIKNIPVKALHTGLPCLIQPDTVSVTLRGAMENLANSFSKKDIKVYMDLAGLGPGIYVKPVKIRLPGQTRLIHVDPQIFTVKIEKH